MDDEDIIETEEPELGSDYGVRDMGQKFHANGEDGFVIETFQDIDPYLKANREMYNQNQMNSKYIHKDTALGNQIASIPMVQIHTWMKEFQNERGLARPPGVADPEFKTFLFAKVSDPEYRAFRVDGRTYRLGKQNG